MFDGRDLDDASRWVDDWQAGIEAEAAVAHELAARLAELTASARSPDNLIGLTVGASGALTGLELDEAIRRRPAQETARSILATLRSAQTALVAAATAVTDETVGAGSETGQAIIRSYRARSS
jgi:hypothetical protein